MMYKEELIQNLESIVCSKCEGSSYWCMSCSIGKKITEELDKYEITKKEEVNSKI